MIRITANAEQARRHFPDLKAAGWCRSSEEHRKSDKYLMRTPSEEGVTEVHFKGVALPEARFEEGFAVMRTVYDKYKLLATNEVVDEAFKTLYAPTTRGLAYQCEHYSKKYGVEIFISPDGDIADILKHFEGNSGNAFGVILETTRRCNGHVIPALFTRENADAPWTVILLDTLGGQAQPIFGEPNVCRNFKDACLERPEIGALYEYTGTRQFAFTGCRTDSLVTLRNFLLHIRQNERFNAEDVIAPGTEVTSGHVQFDSYALSLFHPSQSCLAVKGDEVQIKNRGSTQTKTPHQYRDQYIQSVNIRKSLKTTKGDKLKLVYNQSSKRNVYLAYKGAQIVNNMARGHASADIPALEARVIGEVPDGF